MPAVVAPLIVWLLWSLIFELDAARAALLQLATRDALTQAHNRQHFLEHLPLEVHRAQRSGQPLSLLMLDADHFKQVNDRFGHAMGDAALQAIAAACRRALRPYDLLVRYGGEEFVLLLIGSGLEQAREVAERVRTTIADTALQTPGGTTLRVTVSVGIAALQPGDTGGSLLLERADAALYQAKGDGRNRCAG